MNAGTEEVLRYIIADMVYQQIKEIDLNYEKAVSSKSLDIVRDVYVELQRNIPDEEKVIHLYEIFDNHGILVSLNINSENKEESNE